MNLERAVELLKRADSESKIAGLRHLPVEVINNDGIMDLVLDALTGDEPDTRYAAIQVLKKAGLGGPRSCCGNPAPHGSQRGCSVSISSFKSKKYGTLHWLAVVDGKAGSSQLRGIAPD